jgi:hypothetical protein
VISVGRPKDMMTARKMLVAGAVISASRLSDEQVELGSLMSTR